MKDDVCVQEKDYRQKYEKKKRSQDYKLDGAACLV
jgi:hypothetical protein